MDKGEKFLEKESIDDMVMGLDEKGQYIFASELISKALEEQLTIPVVVKSFPNNEEITDKAYNYINTTKQIWTNQERNALYIGYKQGAYWLRKQAKK